MSKISHQYTGRGEPMQKITPNLWFDGDAEDAVNRYTRIFDDSSIGTISRYDKASAEQRHYQ